MPVTSRDLTISADDGYPLAATLFEAEPGASGRAAPIVIIGAATAVPRRYYAAFAKFLAASGARVLSFDYRGVGGSRPGSLIGFPARMRDWGILDIPGVLSWASAAYPDSPIHWVGHSYGGFGPGLAHNNRLIDRLLAVSSMTAYWRFMEGPERFRVALLMGAVLPAAAQLCGYFPGRLNNAEDLPKGVLLEWARWCMTPQFLFGDETLPERRHFATVRAPARFALVEDDQWVSFEGVRHLADQFPSAAETSIWRIGPADGNAREIGHVGFFRPEFQQTLWRAAHAWLDG
jgi:predicted alpha/beta hydrolase